MFVICRMQILVTAATEMEIAPFIAVNPSTDVLITGVGVPACTYHLLKRLFQIDYDLVIQAGIAGSFEVSDPLGTTVLVAKDVFADVGIEEKNHFYTLEEKGLADPEHFPFTRGWLKNDNDLLQKIPLKKVTSITVNKVSDNFFQSQQYAKKYQPQIQSMEGAALHYVCLNENIPFLQLRSVSNIVGERDKARWKVSEAVQHLNENLKSIIFDLQKL